MVTTSAFATIPDTRPAKNGPGMGVCHDPHRLSTRVPTRRSFDEDVEIYVNGIHAAQASGFIIEYETLPIQAAARAVLKPGDQITLAAHCHQTMGSQGIDVGLCEEKD